MSDRQHHNENFLDWLGLSDAPRWWVARFIGKFFSVVVALLFALAIAAAFSIFLKLLLSNGEPSLGSGALIAALLGAPFVIWGTILKHQTVTFQKEGHMTDRINKAVEQLGVEKSVERIGRSVTIWTGPSRETRLTFSGTESPNSLERAKEIKREATLGETDSGDLVEATRVYYRVWPSERTAIQFQGDEIVLDKDEEVGREADWQVFKESVPNVEVRIGAILSLERIAQDSTRHDKGRDHVRVMEILCAYVRENSNAIPPKDHALGDWTPVQKDSGDYNDPSNGKKNRKRYGRAALGESKLDLWLQTLPKPRVDVALALKVLGRRTEEQRRVEAAWPYQPTDQTIWPFDCPCPSLSVNEHEKELTSVELDAFKGKLSDWWDLLHSYRGYRMDLRGANLQRADMAAQQPDGSDAIYSGALLDDSRLEGANLMKARMETASLVSARMEGSILASIRMQGAHISSARLDCATLSWAHLEGANLESSQMTSADLWFTRLEGGKLNMAFMDGSDFTGARLTGADLVAASMQNARFSSVHLDWADLHDARFNRAYFFKTDMNDGTNLENASFLGAALCDADYSRVNFDQKQLDGAFGDASVTLSQKVSKPIHWPRLAVQEHHENDFDMQYQEWLADPANFSTPAKLNA